MDVNRPPTAQDTRSAAIRGLESALQELDVAVLLVVDEPETKNATYFTLNLSNRSNRLRIKKTAANVLGLWQKNAQIKASPSPEADPNAYETICAAVEALEIALRALGTATLLIVGDRLANEAQFLTVNLSRSSDLRAEGHRTVIAGKPADFRYQRLDSGHL
jgi:hypothetical protein